MCVFFLGAGEKGENWQNGGKRGKWGHFFKHFYPKTSIFCSEHTMKVGQLFLRHTVSPEIVRLAQEELQPFFCTET